MNDSITGSHRAMRRLKWSNVSARSKVASAFAALKRTPTASRSTRIFAMGVGEWLSEDTSITSTSWQPKPITIGAAGAADDSSSGASESAMEARGLGAACSLATLPIERLRPARASRSRPAPSPETRRR